MNLKEFITYRNFCPLCNTALKIYFHSDRRQVVEINDDYLFITFPLLSIKPTQEKNYKVKYCFSLKLPEFHIEFYTKDDIHFENLISQDILIRGIGLHRGLALFEFHKICPRCARYAYYSQKFDLILGHQTPPVVFDYEIYCLNQALNEYDPEGIQDIRCYQLINNHSTNKTLLGFWKEDSVSESCNYAHYRNTEGTYLELPLIPFVSKEKTTNRLSNLLFLT